MVAPCWGFCLPEPIGPEPPEPPLFFLPYQEPSTTVGTASNFVLEGLTDYWYVEGLSELLGEAGLQALDPKIALIPAKSAGKVVYYATILHANDLMVAALLDSDAAGDAAAQQETLVHTLGNKRILRTKDHYVGSCPNRS